MYIGIAYFSSFNHMKNQHGIYKASVEKNMPITFKFIYNTLKITLTVMECSSIFYYSFIKPQMTINKT